MSDVAPLEGDPSMPTKKKAAGTKPAARKRTVSAVPVLPPEALSDLLMAIRDKAIEIDEAREALDALIAESDALIQEAVDEGERYRDIAGAAGRTVPWVQMSLRRVAGVSTHPAAPIPTAKIRRRPRAS